MVKFTPQKITGNWKEGFVLDLHTISSTLIGYDEFGHPQFDTLRSEIGELLFKLKNRSDTSVIPEIVEAVKTFMMTWHPQVNMIVPVPPSNARTVQPVILLAQALGSQIGIPLMEVVRKTRDMPQLKNIFDLEERQKVLKGAYVVDRESVKGRRVLLFDDLFRSGATMNEITTVLCQQGQAKEVYALTITRTRSHR